MTASLYQRGSLMGVMSNPKSQAPNPNHSQIPTTPKSQPLPNPNHSQIPTPNHSKSQIPSTHESRAIPDSRRLGFGNWAWLGVGAWSLGFEHYPHSGSGASSCGGRDGSRTWRMCPTRDSGSSRTEFHSPRQW